MASCATKPGQPELAKATAKLQGNGRHRRLNCVDFLQAAVTQGQALYRPQDCRPDNGVEHPQLHRPRPSPRLEEVSVLPEGPPSSCDPITLGCIAVAIGRHHSAEDTHLRSPRDVITLEADGVGVEVSDASGLARFHAHVDLLEATLELAIHQLYLGSSGGEEKKCHLRRA